MNNPREELRSMNLQDLYAKLQLTDNEFDDWLKQLGLLHRSQICDTCGDRMSEDGRNRRYVCNKSRCRPYGTKPSKGLYAGTFFEDAKIHRKTIFLISYFWAQDYGSYKKVAFETKVNLKTITHYFIKFRQVRRLFSVFPYIHNFI